MMDSRLLIGVIGALLFALLVLARRLDKVRAELAQMLILKNFYEHAARHFEQECDRWANRALRRVRDRRELPPHVAEALKARDDAGLFTCEVCGWFHGQGDPHGPG